MPCGFLGLDLSQKVQDFSTNVMTDKRENYWFWFCHLAVSLKKYTRKRCTVEWNSGWNRNKNQIHIQSSGLATPTHHLLKELSCGFLLLSHKFRRFCTLQEKKRFSHPFSPKGCFSALLQSYTKRLSSLQGKNQPKITGTRTTRSLTMGSGNSFLRFSSFSY